MDKGIKLYTGKRVKSKKIDNTIFQILTIDDYTESIWGIALNSYKVKPIEIKIEDLIEV